MIWILPGDLMTVSTYVVRHFQRFYGFMKFMLYRCTLLREHLSVSRLLLFHHQTDPFKVGDHRRS